MAIVDFITELFCRVDDAMENMPNHSQAALYPSELVTIGLLCAVKGVGGRAFYAGCAPTTLICSRICLNAHACSAAFAHIKTGQTASWSLLHCWASWTRMELN